ncbi:FecR domain-containing protein [uncultured Sphingomonas sp.]|uniref:FecR family protein n=1 Tax=uncultured Sphingomonas sp. TaxID=158754 RepID=UPI0025EFE88D|nr:FecR domain-containing protein [uncultured Sphingomonas sp.]
MANRGDTASRLEDEAAHWAARIDASPDAAPAGLNRWLRADPAHAGALLRAQATLVLLGGAVPETLVAERPGGGRRIWWLGGASAALAASITAALLLLPARGEQIRTGIGEVRTVALNDGSSLAVDAGSELVTHIAGAARLVTLADGKALFRVRHDAHSPFRVQVGKVTITDIGTVFQVEADRDTGMVEVLVSEGEVQVASSGQSVRLVAGQRARFVIRGAAPVATVERVDAAGIERALGWTSGRLDLDGETLGEAVAELNRHNPLQIRLASPALAGEKLYGAFRIDDPAGFAQSAAIGLGTRARIGPDVILIGTPEKK